MERVKSYLLIILSFLIFAFLYFIFSGRFCHCSDLSCPSTDVLRSVLT